MWRTARDPGTRGSSWVAVLVLATLLGPAPARAQSEAGDGGPLFDSRDAWIAGAYLASAALAFPFDEPIAIAIRDSSLQKTPGLQPAAHAFNFLAAPGSLILSGGLYGIGRLAGHDDMADAGLHIGEAIVIAEAVTFSIKLLAGRARPSLGLDDPYDFRLGRGIAREDLYRSFPSGHSAAAFATAAAAAHEIDRVWGGNELLIGLATYGPAALVGLSRMFHNRHWTSDVVFGAAIGAFSGWKVVRYSHSNPDNAVDDFFLAASFVPGDLSTLRLGIVPAR
jgi:membrane-associated phospholipid phosphatase